MTPQTACQAVHSTVSSLFEFMPIESVMPPNRLILCHPFSSFPNVKAGAPAAPRVPRGDWLSLQHSALLLLRHSSSRVAIIGSFGLPSPVRTHAFQSGSQALLFRGNRKGTKLLSQLQSSPGDWTALAMRTVAFLSERQTNKETKKTTRSPVTMAGLLICGAVLGVWPVALTASPGYFPSSGPTRHLPICATELRAKDLCVREGDPVEDSRQWRVQDD